MPEEQETNPKLREAARGWIEMISGVADTQITVALRPVLARIEALERQVAELRDEPTPGATSEVSADDPAP